MKIKYPLTFFLSFCEEMIPEHGEDSFCYAFCDTAGMVGVFDGCGGAGARKHDHYCGETEAYMASRFCAGVFYDQFCHHFPTELQVHRFVNEKLAPNIRECLRQFQPPKDPDGFQIRGSMVRTLPTTAAVALVQALSSGEQMVSPIWAGDSRVYILDEDGLAQLTTDDTSVPDPMDNLYEDGILRNILCSDRTPELHCGSVRMDKPFLVFAATDGCFGYFSTPMEFEGALLDTLMASGSVAQWEELLPRAIVAVAGDDHAISMAAYGYKSFEALKESLAERHAMMHSCFLDELAELPIEDRQTRQAMWCQYRGKYSRYMKDGQT